jgi:hypothetical protein
MFIVTLTFDQWPWIKVMTLPWVQCNNSVKYYSNPCFSEKLWPRQCLKHYEHSDLDPITLNQGHDTSLGRGQQSCEILFKFIKRVRSYGSDKLFAKFNHYVYSDLDLWPITLNQGHDTSLGPGQQSCEILFKSKKRIRSYGSDKLGQTEDGQRHNIICPIWRRVYKNVVFLYVKICCI